MFLTVLLYNKHSQVECLPVNLFSTLLPFGLGGDITTHPADFEIAYIVYIEYDSNIQRTN